MTILQESSGELDPTRPSNKRPFDASNGAASTPTYHETHGFPGSAQGYDGGADVGGRPQSFRNNSYDHRRGGPDEQLAKRVKGFSLK